MIYVYRHNGFDGCGKAAFLYKEKPSVGDVISHTKAMLLDGSIPKKSDPIICGSCGKKIMSETRSWPILKVENIESLHGMNWGDPWPKESE